MSKRKGARWGIPLFLAVIGSVGFTGILGLPSWREAWPVMIGLFLVILALAHFLISTNLRSTNKLSE